MEFPTLGDHCQQEGCNQTDFLPLQCKCGKVLCRVHFLDHCQSSECELAPKPREVNLKNDDQIFKCSEKGCRKGNLHEMLCGKCHKHYCIEHRFHPTCPEIDDETMAAKIEEFEAPRRLFQEANKHLQEKITENIRKALQSSAKVKTASKIHLMRIKQKAVGPKSVPVPDRVYFAIGKPKTMESKPVNVIEDVNNLISIETGVPSPAQQSYPGCREALRMSFERRDVPSAAVDLMLASLSDNTIKQYSVSLKLWWEYCKVNNVDVFSNTISTVMSFLTVRFSEGCSYGSLNSHRSALSLFLGQNIGSDDRIKRILKGAYKIKPNSPKYKSTWDPQLVLNFISNWHPNLDLPLDKITKKLTTLLALCTAHRVQTFSLIRLENITISDSGVRISITDTIKTSAPGRDQPVLFLPFFLEKPNICPASVLKDYIFRTKNLRTENAGKLLLTTKYPHRAATAQSISRWIKTVLSESGVDTRTFSAHSTRHAATSAARSAGLRIDAIRKTAGWTANSNVFAKFYNRPIVNTDSDFARSVLNKQK